jgi:hypothetical protein
MLGLNIPMGMLLLTLLAPPWGLWCQRFAVGRGRWGCQCTTRRVASARTRQGVRPSLAAVAAVIIYESRSFDHLMAAIRAEGCLRARIPQIDDGRLPYMRPPQARPALARLFNEPFDLSHF